MATALEVPRWLFDEIAAWSWRRPTSFTPQRPLIVMRGRVLFSPDEHWLARQGDSIMVRRPPTGR